jgi:hypothetical protein
MWNQNTSLLSVIDGVLCVIHAIALPHLPSRWHMSVIPFVRVQFTFLSWPTLRLNCTVNSILSSIHLSSLSNALFTCNCEFLINNPSESVWGKWKEMSVIFDPTSRRSGTGSAHPKNLQKRLSYPCNRPWRSIRLWDVEALTFSRQSAHRWWWGCQPYAPAVLYPPWRFLVLISVRSWVDPRTIVRLEGLGNCNTQLPQPGIEPATFRLVA